MQIIFLQGKSKNGVDTFGKIGGHFQFWEVFGFCFFGFAEQEIDNLEILNNENRYGFHIQRKTIRNEFKRYELKNTNLENSLFVRLSFVQRPAQ